MSGIKLRPIVFKVVPPAPKGDLLYEQAPQTYSGSWQTFYEARTLTTDKDFICYKMSVHHNTDSSLAMISIGDSNDEGWQYMAHPEATYGLQRIETIMYIGSGTSSTPLVAGLNGVASGYTQTTSSFNPDPMPPISTTEFTTVRFVFQKSTRKAYFYIDGLQVAICNDWSTSYDPFAQSLSASIAVDMTFGIQVYGCETLEAAEQC